MKVFAISDLHLSHAVEKPMDIFGDGWLNHFERVCEDWRARVSEDDLVLLGGDYASPSLFERLNGGADESDARSRFFAALAGFQAPLGIYAISGDNDGGLLLTVREESA